MTLISRNDRGLECVPRGAYFPEVTHASRKPANKRYFGTGTGRLQENPQISRILGGLDAKKANADLQRVRSPVDWACRLPIVARIRFMHRVCNRPCPSH
ncbi:MAG TPA: hypothetical protein DGU45_01265 [Planctomycetes bacterium]|nr:hypothetical protein [Planctomycetota bacterium]